MTVPVVIKLLEAKGKVALDAAVAAYVAGAGAALLTTVRGGAMAAYRDPADDSNRIFMALAHAGDVTPATKVADSQFIFVEGDTIAALQTALNTALANITHHRNATGDFNTNTGDVNVTGATFQATDVGRTIVITGGSVPGGTTRTITAFTSATRVTYSGAAITGTSVVVELKGAECINHMRVESFRERDTDPHFSVSLWCEGQTT